MKARSTFAPVSDRGNAGRVQRECGSNRVEYQCEYQSTGGLHRVGQLELLFPAIRFDMRVQSRYRHSKWSASAGHNADIDKRTPQRRETPRASWTQISCFCYRSAARVGSAGVGCGTLKDGEDRREQRVSLAVGLGCSDDRLWGIGRRFKQSTRSAVSGTSGNSIIQTANFTLTVN